MTGHDLSALFKRWLILLAVAVGQTLAAATPKIAVLDLSGSSLEPLIVAELTKYPEVELIERQEIQHLADEKRRDDLVADSQFATLGGMLGADGLLILERIDGVLAARLIGVRTGACLFGDSFSREKESGGKIRVVLAAKTARVAASLLVERADAIPVSVLNLRATVFNPANARIEMSLTRLLELRLAHLSKVILLERRQLGDTGFERSLDAADLPPLRNGAFLVDGSFEAGDGERLAVKLRLRRPGSGEPVTMEVSGGRSDLATLVDRLATNLAPALGSNLSAQTWDCDDEATAYFHEAAWAWRAGAYREALQAAESARALGDQSPELAALMAWLLAEKAVPEGVFYQGKYLSPWQSPAPAEQARSLEMALAEFGEFRDGGASLKRLKDVAPYELRRTDLERNLVEKAGELLRSNDAAPSAVNMADLRSAAHDTVGMQSSGEGIADTLAAAFPHVGDFARDSDELIAFYEKVLRSQHQWMAYMLAAFPKKAGEALGPRFENDRKALETWEQTLTRLEHDPVSRLRVLLIRSGNAQTPEEREIYRRYLAEIAVEGPALFQAGQLDDYLEGDPRGRSFHSDFHAERSALLLSLLNNLPAHEPDLFHLVDRLEVPEDRRQEVWQAFGSYRERCLTAAQGNDRRKFESSFALLASTLLEGNPGIRTSKPPNSLAVKRFWHPYGRVDGLDETLWFNQILVRENSVWVCPVKPKGLLLEVGLPDLELKSHPVPGAGPGAQFAVTADAVWMEYGEYPESGGPMEMFLVRQQRDTGELRNWPLLHGGTLEVADGRIFLSFNGASPDQGLAEFDPETGHLRTWVSTRRNPPETPFDTRGDLRVRGVVEGPGGRPHMVALDGKRSGIYAIGGAWAELAGDFTAYITRSGRTSLLTSTDKVLLLDPNLGKPQIWLAGPSGTPEERASARWPEAQDFETWRWSLGDYFAFRAGELFSLERDAGGGYRLHWWFDGAPPGGMDVPLRFELSASTRAELEIHRDNFKSPVEWNGLLDPSRASGRMQMATARDGLILTRKQHGFWFLPFADLQRWRSRHP